MPCSQWPVNSDATRQGRPQRPAGRRWTIMGSLLALVGVAVAAAVATRSADPVAPGADANEGSHKVIDAIATEAIRNKVAPGLAIAIGRSGRVEFTHGYGLANIERGLTVQPGSIFRIGSLTKQFTAAAIMQLVERGRIDLDDRVAGVIVDIPGLDPSITVRQLLSHTSGIPDYTTLDRFARLRSRDLSHADLLGLVASAPRDFAPGTQWRYSNSGYYLLGLILEKVTGLPYAEYMKSKIFEPLGLHSTAYCDDRNPALPRVVGYHSDRDGTVRPADVISMKPPFSAGALCSSAEDLVRWTQALVAGKVVSAESLAHMTTPTRLPDGTEQPVGFGLAVGRSIGSRTIFFGGVIEGFTSQLTYYADRDVVPAALANNDIARLTRVGDRIAEVAVGAN